LTKKIMDTNVCPSLNLKEKDDAQSQEEERILRHMGKLPPATAGPTNDKLGLWLEGFPAVPGKPVVVVLEGKQVYHSGNLNGTVRETFKADLHPISAQPSSELSLQLKIGVKDFDNILKVDVKDGHYLKLVFTEQGLSINQRMKPY